MIINRLEHCESYNFCLEFEIALDASLANNSTHITHNILIGERNCVFHVEWDNLNKMLTNIHGNSIVNSTGGIMIQEVKSDYVADKTQSSRESNQQTSSLDLLLDSNTDDLQPVHNATRKDPSFPKEASFLPPVANDVEYDLALKRYRTWILARILGGGEHEQSVPGFSGFTSATGIKPERKSTIEYFVPIDHPFTSYATIRELLKRSELATNKVGQKYVLSTFDLGGCMKALPLIWHNPDLYQNHVVSPGSFHTVMNYLGILTNRKCSGSGYAEILVESGLVTNGRLDAVLRGKAYAKAKFSIKAQERILRGVSPKHLVPGPATKKTNDFKLFLCNDENKQQLCKVWSSDDAYSRINQCDSAMLVVDGKLYSLSPINGKVSHDASTSSYTFNNSPTWHNLLTV